MISGETLSLRCKRLLYRATHRGMRELDVTYGAWVAQLVADKAFDEARGGSVCLTALEVLLERSEPDLLDLLWGRLAPQNEEEAALLHALKEFLQTR